MSLRDRIGSSINNGDPTSSVALRPTSTNSRSHHDLKMHVHRMLLDRVDLQMIENLSPERLKEELRAMVERILDEEGVVINEFERRNLVRDIQYEMLGLGPLEPLLA